MAEPFSPPHGDAEGRPAERPDERRRDARLPSVFYSFRVRLLMVLALLLVATLGVQYYLNSLEQATHSRIIAEQEQALAASYQLALNSITTSEYMFEIDSKLPVPILEQFKGRVMNILVLDDEGSVRDSLDRQYLPKQLDDGTVSYLKISEVPLPRLVEAGQPTDQLKRQIGHPDEPSGPPLAGEPRAFPIPVRTADGVYHIIVALGAAQEPAANSWALALQPLLPTLFVLLLATTAAAVLVWRFTRPIDALSRATGRVAAGDFDFRVEGGHRRDETGALVTTFNDMIGRLGQLRELESKIKQAEHSAVVGRLASAIAHEVRNPLNYINLTLDHLRTSLAPEDEKKRAVFSRLTEQLKAEVARINTRISEFLKYARPAKLEKLPLDLPEVAEDAMRMVEVQAGEMGVATSIERGGEVPQVLGDRESLRSVFTNLIINGMQAMGGEGGRLTVRFSSEDGAVRAEVADTGRGIPAEDLPKIFEPYFSTKDTGTGLGLAIVKKAIDDHGGHVSVTSQPGRGTTFTVTIPIGGNKD